MKHGGMRVCFSLWSGEVEVGTSGRVACVARLTTPPCRRQGRQMEREINSAYVVVGQYVGAFEGMVVVGSFGCGEVLGQFSACYAAVSQKPKLCGKGGTHKLSTLRSIRR